jgi:hypothetical protein
VLGRAAAARDLTGMGSINHSDAYLTHVLDQARRYTALEVRAPPTARPTSTRRDMGGGFHSNHAVPCPRRARMRMIVGA